MDWMFNFLIFWCSTEAHLSQIMSNFWGSKSDSTIWAMNIFVCSVCLHSVDYKWQKQPNSSVWTISINHLTRSKLIYSQSSRTKICNTIMKMVARNIFVFHRFLLKWFLKCKFNCHSMSRSFAYQRISIHPVNFNAMKFHPLLNRWRFFFSFILNNL